MVEDVGEEAWVVWVVWFVGDVDAVDVFEDEPHPVNASVRATTTSTAGANRTGPAPRSPRRRGSSDITTDTSAHAPNVVFRQDQSP
jgi:hypothetical protein